jgi:chromosome segregation ATPase
LVEGLLHNEFLRLTRELVLGEEPESQALQREIQSIEQVLCDLNNTQAALVSDIHDTKEASKEIARKYEEVRKATELARRENEKLKSRIIRSPEKVKKHIAEMSVTLSKERQSLKDTERKQGEVQIRLQAIGKINKDIDKCIKILEEINIEQGKNKQEKKKIKEQKARLASMEDVLREVKNNQQVRVIIIYRFVSIRANGGRFATAVHNPTNYKHQRKDGSPCRAARA